MDVIQLYVDNEFAINFAINFALGAFALWVGENLFLKNKIRDARMLLDALDDSLVDNNIDAIEQKKLIACVRELIGVDLFTKIRGLGK